MLNEIDVERNLVTTVPKKASAQRSSAPDSPDPDPDSYRDYRLR